MLTPLQTIYDNCVMPRMLELDDDLCLWIEQHGLNVQEVINDALRAFRGDIPFMDLVRLAAPVRDVTNATALFGRDPYGHGRTTLKQAEYAALSDDPKAFFVPG